MFKGWIESDITDLRGAWTRLQNRDARPNRAFAARNVRFEPGRVRSRDGFAALAYEVSGKATSFYNWVGSGLNRLIYVVGGSDVRMRNLSGSSDVSLFTATCAGVTVAEAGDKALIGSYTSSGGGAAQVRISFPLVGTGEVDKAFPGPLTSTFTAADFGTGNCSQGTKRLGYIIESRSGFTGKPSPVSLGTFAPVSVTVAAGGRTVRAQMTFNVPADAAILHPICTRTDNPDKWYFEPGMSIGIPGGAAAWPATWYYTASDESLEASAVEVVNNFDLLTQDALGVGPFSPLCVAAYGKRAVYLTPNRAYISEPGDYQAITEALHGLELPGKRQMIAAFPFRQSLYILGPGWTYEVADNGDYPSTWANATEISSAIGTPSIKGVCWRTAGDYVWVAAESGLYVFNGSYSRLPISYMNADWWERINWAAAQSLFIVDDYIRQRVIVFAPIDAATSPSHMLVWDYSRGMGPADVDFAYYDSAVTFSAGALVKDSTTGEQSLWIGPSAAGKIRAETEGTVCEAASEYESGHLLTQKPKKWVFFGGCDFDVSGSGSLAIKVYGKDHTVDTDAGPITLSDTPGEHPQERFHLQSENASIKVSVPAGSRFDLSGLNVYVRPWVGNR